MLQITDLTKELLKKHLAELMNEAKGFDYINWTEENYLKELPDKWHYSMAAFIDNSICGFSINSNKFGTFYIHFFYIFRDYRNMGIGKKLLERCESICSNNGLNILHLKCHKDNSEAIKFYSKHGFEISCVDTNNSNLYVMEKNLK